jgi:hypothetical protein
MPRGRSLSEGAAWRVVLPSLDPGRIALLPIVRARPEAQGAQPAAVRDRQPADAPHDLRSEAPPKKFQRVFGLPFACAIKSGGVMGLRGRRF